MLKKDIATQKIQKFKWTNQNMPHCYTGGPNKTCQHGHRHMALTTSPASVHCATWKNPWNSICDENSLIIHITNMDSSLRYRTQTLHWCNTFCQRSKALPWWKIRFHHPKNKCDAPFFYEHGFVMNSSQNILHDKLRYSHDDINLLGLCTYLLV